MQPYACVRAVGRSACGERARGRRAGRWSPLVVHVETIVTAPSCPNCGERAWVKDRPVVELVDLPCFGRPAGWCGASAVVVPEAVVRVGVVDPEDQPRSRGPRLAMTDRAGSVGDRTGRPARPDRVNEVAGRARAVTGTPINDAVIAYGTALVDDDPNRIGDSHRARARRGRCSRGSGRWRTPAWSTSIVDVRAGPAPRCRRGPHRRGAVRLARRPDQAWCDRIEWATLDLSGPYRKVFDTMLPDATQVADPFHLVKLANHEARRGAAAGSRTRRSATGATRTTRSTGAGGC